MRRKRNETEEGRLRRLRDHYRGLHREERLKRKVLERQLVLLKRKHDELREVNAFAAKRLRQQRNVAGVVVAGLMFLCGMLFSGPRHAPDVRPDELHTASLQVPASSECERARYLPACRCEPCDCGTYTAPTATESHILASVKMQNGSTGCSATVLGDPRDFRRHRSVLVVSAAHCVAGRIGGQATFYNPDGRTDFEGTLIAYDREIDAALFAADSADVLGAVLMAEPGSFDQHAKFSACNYPAKSGGPNYKLVTYSGGFDSGANTFRIDDASRENGGYHSSGGSGGGLFVQPAGESGWFFFSATTAETLPRGNGTIVTPSHAKVFAFVAEHVPADWDCGPWCRKCPPKKQPQKPGEQPKPPWYNPNVPVEPQEPPEEPPPQPQPSEPQQPAEPNPVVIERIERIEKELKFLVLKEGPQGPQGPAGNDGKTPEVDYARLEVAAGAAAKATVEAMVAAGGLRGPAGETGEAPQVDVDALVEQVVQRLPPVRMVIRKDGVEYPNEKPLGVPLLMDFGGRQITVPTSR